MIGAFGVVEHFSDGEILSAAFVYIVPMFLELHSTGPNQMFG